MSQYATVDLAELHNLPNKLEDLANELVDYFEGRSSPTLEVIHAGIRSVISSLFDLVDDNTELDLVADNTEPEPAPLALNNLSIEWGEDQIRRQGELERRVMSSELELARLGRVMSAELELARLEIAHGPRLPELERMVGDIARTQNYGRCGFFSHNRGISTFHERCQLPAGHGGDHRHVSATDDLTWSR